MNEGKVVEANESHRVSALTAYSAPRQDSTHGKWELGVLV